MDKQKSKVLVIVGATASGKTGLSIKLAKHFKAEVISADSMQIYKGLDIGTAKVTKEEMEGIPHHLIDILEPGENFSVADYKELCYEKIDEIVSRGKLPIIVGGTGLYINSVVNNMKFNNIKDIESDNSDNENILDEEYRKHLEDILAKDGKEALYNMLVEKDLEASKNIHMNNTKRVMRALEIVNKYGAKSDIENRQDLWNRNPSLYDFFVIYLNPQRDILYDRINRRVEIMAVSGIIEEAKILYDMELDGKTTCNAAIGYKEWFGYLEGKTTKEDCIHVLKQSTRRYAKRQTTWFNKLGYEYMLEDGNVTEDEIIEIQRRIYGNEEF